MRVGIIGIPVLDQAEALAFYTEKLGFIKKHDIPVGGGNRWLTVVSEEDPDGPEISLEPAPLHFEPAKIYQKALLDKGIPYTQFDVDDADAEHQRLEALGVVFTMPPKEMGTVKACIFQDTCGNNIQLVEYL